MNLPMTTTSLPDDPYLFSTVLAPVPEVLKEARDLVEFAFGQWGLDGYVARLVVTELVSNAIKASAPDGHIVVRVHLNGDRPTLEVWDQSDELPVIKTAGGDDEAGRGIFLVDALSDRWGVRPLLEVGKVVWAELPRTEAEDEVATPRSGSGPEKDVGSQPGG
jgi:anti-sigma regulatory factor (Ser/Thr protein kinase)